MRARVDLPQSVGPARTTLGARTARSTACHKQGGNNEGCHALDMQRKEYRSRHPCLAAQQRSRRARVGLPLSVALALHGTHCSAGVGMETIGNHHVAKCDCEGGKVFQPRWWPSIFLAPLPHHAMVNISDSTSYNITRLLAADSAAAAPVTIGQTPPSWRSAQHAR